MTVLETRVSKHISDINRMMQENTYETIVHHLWLLTLNDKLFLAPIGEEREGMRILDIGTGTGLWAM